MSDDKGGPPIPFTMALISGGVAGTTVDVALYPLDTLRTRLQSPQGFAAAGGFKGVYNGCLATALGAAPGAAMFFSAYESMKPRLRTLFGGEDHPLVHSISAATGEVAACLVRVPTAVVTQRMQVGQYKTFGEAVTKIWAENGLATFFTGYWCATRHAATTPTRLAHTLQTLGTPASRHLGRGACATRKPCGRSHHHSHKCASCWQDDGRARNPLFVHSVPDVRGPQKGLGVCAGAARTAETIQIRTTTGLPARRAAGVATACC